MGAVTLSMLTLNAVDRGGLSASRVKPWVINLIFAASPTSNQHYRRKTKD